MSEPSIELIPIRPAVRSDASLVLDVLVRVVPPAPDRERLRPPLNVGLVIDRSGSMSGGRKMDFARDAAAFAVGQLLPTDRVSITIFDEVVEVIAPSQRAENKAALLSLIRRIEPRGSTDLYAGWSAGASEVEEHLATDGLNRVLLLSDGLANVGLTDPNRIAELVKQSGDRGVSTTTLGVGDDYNEDLMERMAVQGDGNYYYIEAAPQLTDIFQTELRGLMATIGQKVSLGVEPLNGVTLLDVLNDFETTEFGRSKLPNLVVGMPVPVVVRLNVPALGGDNDLCRFRLAWDPPRGGTRRVVSTTLPLPSVVGSRWEALADEPRVSEQVALLMAARAKKEAVRALDSHDIPGTRRRLEEARLCAMMSPPSPALDEELSQIEAIRAELDRGEYKKFRKQTTAQRYNRTQGKPPVS